MLRLPHCIHRFCRTICVDFCLLMLRASCACPPLPRNNEHADHHHVEADARLQMLMKTPCTQVELINNNRVAALIANAGLIEPQCMNIVMNQFGNSIKSVLFESTRSRRQCDSEQTMWKPFCSTICRHVYKQTPSRNIILRQTQEPSPIPDKPTWHAIKARIHP